MSRFFLLLLMLPLGALPLNNPLQSVLICDSTLCPQPCGYTIYGMLNVRLGFYGDYMFDTAMKVRRGQRDDSIYDFSIMTNALEVDLTVCGLDLAWVVGAAKMRMESPSSTFQINAPGSNTELVVQSSTDVVWGLGGRYALLRCSNWGVGIEGQYLTSNPHITYVLDFGSGSVNQPGGSQDMRYRAGQLGAGVTYEFAACDSFSLDPYMGLFWTYSTVDFGKVALNHFGSRRNENLRLYDLKKQRQYGWALGITAVQCAMATVTLEGRFGGEKALFVFGQFQY